MDSRKLALLCREFADNKKAEDIAVLNVREVSSVTDYFVIASGTSEPHLRAIVDEITDKLRDDYQLRPKAIDGTLQTAWIVLDYFDVIVHVMRRDVRERYDLETLWGDAPRVKPKKQLKVSPKSQAPSNQNNIRTAARTTREMPALRARFAGSKKKPKPKRRK